MNELCIVMTWAEFTLVENNDDWSLKMWADEAAEEEETKESRQTFPQFFRQTECPLEGVTPPHLCSVAAHQFFLFAQLRWRNLWSSWSSPSPSQHRRGPLLQMCLHVFTGFYCADRKELTGDWDDLHDREAPEYLKPSEVNSKGHQSYFLMCMNVFFGSNCGYAKYQWMSQAYNHTN